MKQKIIDMLRNFHHPWGELVDYINDNPPFMESANKLAIQALREKFNDVTLVELLVHLIENNNILFHKNSDYILCQKHAKSLYVLIEDKSVIQDRFLRARGYIACVYADFIYTNTDVTHAYETKLLESLEVFESVALMVNTRFLAYISVSQFYLFQGRHEKTIVHLEKAKKLLNLIKIQNYIALFWYHNSWIYVENGDYKQAKRNIESFFSRINKQSVSPAIYLHGLNIRASIDFRLNNHDMAFRYAKKCYALAIKFYGTEAKDVIAESLVTMSRYHKMVKRYSTAEKDIKKAISVFEIIFGSSNIDPSQATAHVILGEIYQDTRRYNEAKNEYATAEKIYQNLYKENFYKMNEVGILLANLAILGKQIADSKITLEYMKKLTANFPNSNENVKRALSFLDSKIDALGKRKKE